ncbi:hypothetical protein EVA_08685, partial [gut metagenome]
MDVQMKFDYRAGLNLVGNEAELKELVSLAREAHQELQNSTCPGND